MRLYMKCISVTEAEVKEKRSVPLVPAALVAFDIIPNICGVSLLKHHVRQELPRSCRQKEPFYEPAFQLAAIHLAVSLSQISTMSASSRWIE